jgi:hypothetical protein
MASAPAVIGGSVGSGVPLVGVNKGVRRRATSKVDAVVASKAALALAYAEDDADKESMWRGYKTEGIFAGDEMSSQAEGSDEEGSVWGQGGGGLIGPWWQGKSSSELFGGWAGMNDFRDRYDDSDSESGDQPDPSWGENVMGLPFGYGRVAVPDKMMAPKDISAHRVTGAVAGR